MDLHSTEYIILCFSFISMVRFARYISITSLYISMAEPRDDLADVSSGGKSVKGGEKDTVFL